MTPEQLHRESIVIDATCPLAVLKPYLANYKEGGNTVIAATVGYGAGGLGNINFTMRNLGTWYEAIRSQPDKLLLITSVEDIYRAQAEDKLGILFHFQGSVPFEDDPNMAEVYYRLGLRMCQLCYNIKDLVGCGCAEKTDGGLTAFGEQIIGEMNRLGIVVDCAHTGIRTTMDALEVSKQPVIISHGNSKAVCNNARNLDDDLMLAVAANGGVIGFNGYPAFVAKKEEPDLEDLLDHVDHMVKLVGPDFVCIGMDYYEYQNGVADIETAQFTYDFLVETGSWRPEEYPPPPWHYPKGVEMPEKMANLTAGLVQRGYKDEDIKKILGLNLIRVFKEVWK